MFYGRLKAKEEKEAKAAAANADVSGAGGARESGSAMGATASSNYVTMYRGKQWIAMNGAELKQAFKDNKAIDKEITKIISVIDTEIAACKAAM